MNVNLTAISVGNSNVRVGTFIDGNLSEAAVAPVGDIVQVQRAAGASWNQVKGLARAELVLASVNPKPSEELAKWISAQLGVKPQRVERDLKIPIGRQLDRETLVGDDRLLNAAAAYDVLKQACVVVDAGTAVTIDFIDGTGTFHGGAIAPGAEMMLRALHASTAQLPEVSLQRPEEALGHNTAEAMRSGVFHGIRGMTRELVEQFAETAGVFPLVVGTGGDAALLFEGWDLIDRIVPNLTLLGMAVTLQSSLDADEEEIDSILQYHMLAVSRWLWWGLIAGQAMLIAVVALLRQRQTLEVMDESMGRLIFLIAAAAWPVCVGLGYHLRNQVYKRYWQGQAITPRGYFTGNQVLFMLCMANSSVGLVSILAGEPWWPGLLPSLGMLAVMAVNFPNGKAMAPAMAEWVTERQE